MDTAPKLYRSERIDVRFDASRCLHFAECIRGLPEVFDPGKRPWITPDQADAAQVAAIVRRCPSGALQYVSRSEPDEVGDSPTTIEQIPDGPLLIRGELEVRLASEHGLVAVRETRMAACGCGRTEREPYCSGACENPRGRIRPRRPAAAP